MSTTGGASPAPDKPFESPATAAKARRDWQDHAARTTAVLAVLAAVSSGQYAGQFSRTILAQAEASNQWAYYQAKSIKRSLQQSQAEMAHAMGVAQPQLSEQVKQVEAQAKAAIARYENELAEIKAKAEAIEVDKDKHQRMGDRFQLAFIILQAGVVLSTVASSSRRKELWVSALVAGVLGLLFVLNGFLLLR